MVTRLGDAAALADLDDYVRGHATNVPIESFEEDLFARALTGEAKELGLYQGVHRELRLMNELGSIELWLTKSQVEGLVARGVRLAVYELDLDHVVPPLIPPGIDLFVTRVRLPLADVNSLDAEIFSHDGRLLKTMPDIQFDREEGAVYACCEVELARAATQVKTRARLWAGTDAGRRLLVEIAL